MTHRKLRWNISCAVMILLVVIMVYVFLIYGHTVYSLQTVIKVILGIENNFTIKNLRIPRAIAALLSGWSFGMAGYVFQSLLRNPLASPDIIGVSSGTSVAAVIGILVLHLNSAIVSVAALFSGIAVSVLVYCLANSREGFSHSKMILIGIGIQALLKAVTNYILIRSSEYDVAQTLRWLTGSLNNVRPEQLGLYTGAVIVASVILLSLARHLEVIQLGNDYATTLGIRTKVIYIILIVCSVILVAFTTSVTGPIASVAFLAGPIAVRICGKSRSNLLTSGLVGALLVQISDMAGMYLFRVRYPVGVITGILGAPYLIFLLININKKGDAV